MLEARMVYRWGVTGGRYAVRSFVTWAGVFAMLWA